MASRLYFRARPRRLSRNGRARHKTLRPWLLQGTARGNASRPHPPKKRRRILQPLLRRLNAPRSRRIRSKSTTLLTRGATATLRFSPLVHHHRSRNRFVTLSPPYMLTHEMTPRKTQFFFLQLQKNETRQSKAAKTKAKKEEDEITTTTPTGSQQLPEQKVSHTNT